MNISSESEPEDWPDFFSNLFIPPAGRFASAFARAAKKKRSDYSRYFRNLRTRSFNFYLNSLRKIRQSILYLPVAFLGGGLIGDSSLDELMGLLAAGGELPTSESNNSSERSVRALKK